MTVKIIKNLILTVLTSAVLIAALGLLFSSVNGDAVVPRQFFEARVKAAETSKNLARLVNDSLLNLNKISELERKSEAEQALDLIHFEIENSRERQNSAVLLSNELEQMARATANMDPAKAERLAVEAVTTGVATVSQLISYNDLLGNLLVVLQERINNGTVMSPDPITNIVGQMNDSAMEINRLSDRFNDLLEDFDKKFVD